MSSLSAALQVAGVWRTVKNGTPALRCRFSLQSCLCPTPDLRSFHMGIALTTFSAFSICLRTLTRCLHRISTFQEPSAADAPKRPSRHQTHGAPSSQGAGATGPDKTQLRPSSPSHPRPLRGNWPFTVGPQIPPAGSTAQFSAANTGSRAFMPLPPSGHRATCGSPRPAAGSSSRAAKVFGRASASNGSGRLVIAGRMADVCAELDRLAASEAALQAY